MRLALLIVIALAGLVTGGFLNFCIDRLPLNIPINPFAGSGAGQRRSLWKSLLPVKESAQRHRGIRQVLAQRSVWVQVSMATIFVLLFWRFGLTIQSVILGLYSCVFMVLLVIDLEHRLILNKVVYPSIAATIIINLFLPEPGIGRALLGGAIGFGLFFVTAVVARGGMGWGDVKMALLIGLVVGLPQVFVALLLAVLLGGTVATTLVVLRIKRRKEVIPFGPFLAIGTLVTLFYGKEILDWFLRMAEA